MLNQTRIFSVAIATFFILIAATSFAQEQPQKNTDTKHQHMEGHMHQHKGMDMQEGEKADSKSIVREGEIDLAAIDGNEDGKVYQDQMCWNVLSDEKGECPLCGMILKEVTLEDAEKNLVENGFETK